MVNRYLNKKSEKRNLISRVDRVNDTVETACYILSFIGLIFWRNEKEKLDYFQNITALINS